MSESQSVPLESPGLHLAVTLMVGLSACKFLIHFLLSGRYGYFRDELYYLDTARHLDWGYVDLAPLTAVYAKIGLLLGGSLPAIRLLPALAGAGLVALTIYITYRLGGGRFAQGLAGLAVLVSPAFLAVNNFLSMNVFEPLFWMGCIALVIRVIQTGDSRLWIWFGLLAGLGLQNKHSALFFGFAVMAALLLTKHRREYAGRWIWLGGIVAVLIFLPNIVWQIRHDFPTLEDLENVRAMGKNVVLGPGQFVWQQIFLLHPILFPLWLAGLVSFLRHSQWRILGWTYVVFFLTMFSLDAKNYYLFPIYPMLFAGGAVAADRWMTNSSNLKARLWPKMVMVTIILTAAAAPDLFVLPILSPEKYIEYSGFLNLEQVKTEVGHRSRLPQFLADQFGWEELVADVAKVYESLPPDEREHTGIFANNYGEAGAINLFGQKHRLPKAICAHQNHYFWGPPAKEPETMIVLQASPERMKQFFESVEVAGTHYHPYGMEEENGDILLCRGPKVKLADIWPRLKHWN